MRIYTVRKVLSFALFGGIVGGLIAVVGYLILSPEVDSVVVFVVLRVLVGIAAAVIAGPVIKR